jgi:methyl-accepting chemotaxis protein
MSTGEKNVSRESNGRPISSDGAAGGSDVSHGLCAQLTEAGQELGAVCRDADPLFIRTGRDLREVAREIRALTEAIRHAARLVVGSGEQQGPLAGSGQVVQDVLTRLTRDRQEIEQDLQQIRDLITHISDCRRINDAIDRISASFRAVRINIRIQCSAQLISEDIFKDVTQDIDLLSKTLTRITKQIKSDLSAAVKKLIALERTVSANLLAAERVSVSARGVVTRAYGDIKQLFSGTQSMIREASRRSEVITGQVDEIVVSIQFHDSLSQRANHILHAFADVTRLCTPGEGSNGPEGLGSAFLIMDLQHRHLAHIIEEISSIHSRIRGAFSVIGEEVKGLNSIQLDNQFKAAGPEQFLRSLYNSLQKALLQLCDLVSEGAGMIEQINSAAADTRNVAGRLMEIMQDVMEMREETRLQAVNTIIMASNLGQRGRTIQVLAKEISALSEQTSELVSDVEDMQLAVNQKVEKLCKGWDLSIKAADGSELHEEVNKIDDSSREVEKGFTALSAQIDSSCAHIARVHDSLRFIQHLQDGLRSVAARVAQARDTLLPWRDLASTDRGEISQLIQRYTMEQERLIHMFDQAETEQARQDGVHIFF